MSKIAPRHNESDLTRKKSGEGVAGFNRFFVEVCKVLRLPQKMSPTSPRSRNADGYLQ